MFVKNLSTDLKIELDFLLFSNYEYVLYRELYLSGLPRKGISFERPFGGDVFEVTETDGTT